MSKCQPVGDVHFVAHNPIRTYANGLLNDHTRIDGKVGVFILQGAKFNKVTQK